MPAKRARPALPIPKPRTRDAIRKILDRVEEKKKLRGKAAMHLHEKGHISSSDALDIYSGNAGHSHDHERDLPYYAALHQTLREECPSLNGKNVLHMGSSTGVFTRFLQGLGVKAYALDISNAYASAARHIGNKRVVVGDVNDRHLPFKPNSFQTIISDHFLFAEYPRLGFSYQEAKILKRAHRLLKKGGVLIVAESHFSSMGTLPISIEKAITKMGFGIKIIPYGQQYKAKAIWVLRKVK